MIVTKHFCRRRLVPFNNRFAKKRVTTVGVDRSSISSSIYYPCFVFGGVSTLTSMASSAGRGGNLAQQPTPLTNIDNAAPNPAAVTLEEKERRIAMLEMKNWKWLADMSPGFAVKGSNVHVLTDPSIFYQTVIDKISKAKNRISLASLYLGNGQLEQDMVEAIKKSVERNPSLKVNILLDYTRGSRGEENSRTMIVPLLQQSQSCQLCLYHTPTLRGLVKRWLPPRWNEVIGLQHMKVYLFDDSVLISGANLSNDYFTNRQDRYVLIDNSPDMANFFDELVNKVSGFSFAVNSKNELNLQNGWTIHPSEGDQEEFIRKAKASITSFYDDWKRTNADRLNVFLREWEQVLETDAPEHLKNDTWIFPLIQMGALNIALDHEATCEVFKRAPTHSTVKLATGYFNLTSEYINTIIGNSTASYEILMAHPKANGFLGARGFAGGIPAAYTLLAKKFFENIKTQNQEKRISMWEYVRPNWTFHAKGLWYYPVGSKLPVLTLVGSPNFGHRSVHRDLETQLYLITLNNELRLTLDKEQRNVFENAKPFSSLEIVKPERQVPLWVKMVILFFRNFF